MEGDVHSLDQLLIGKKAIVVNLAAEGAERRRLLDLGLIQGTLVEALHKSPAGDPIAYFIMGGSNRPAQLRCGKSIGIKSYVKICGSEYKYDGQKYRFDRQPQRRQEHGL
jgi:Fe2+ transport system protein FeoA